MIQKLKQTALKEGRGVMMFLIVGGLSFLIYAGIYALLSRLVFPEANRTLMNLLAICSSTGFNFLAHRGWTYRATEGRHADQIWKYSIVVVTATLLQMTLFWTAVEKIGIYDGYAVIPIAGICATYTYFTHRLFTFRKPQIDTGVL